MTPELLHRLQLAVDLVRRQIPRAQLTLASVEQLLEAAEAIGTAPLPPRRPPRQPSELTARRKAVREKWARIAQEATTEAEAAAD